jgi:DNA repair exonuclease SbcCD ATPase subunit
VNDEPNDLAAELEAEQDRLDKELKELTELKAQEDKSKTESKKPTVPEKPHGQAKDEKEHLQAKLNANKDQMIEELKTLLEIERKQNADLRNKLQDFERRLLEISKKLESSEQKAADQRDKPARRDQWDSAKAKFKNAVLAVLAEWQKIKDDRRKLVERENAAKSSSVAPAETSGETAPAKPEAPAESSNDDSSRIEEAGKQYNVARKVADAVNSAFRYLGI